MLKYTWKEKIIDKQFNKSISISLNQNNTLKEKRPKKKKRLLLSVTLPAKLLLKVLSLLLSTELMSHPNSTVPLFILYVGLSFLSTRNWCSIARVSLYSYMTMVDLPLNKKNNLFLYDNGYKFLLVDQLWCDHV